ncbi:MAG: serine/threonine-protein kinase, partial [Myxococcaceae bacterium]
LPHLVTVPGFVEMFLDEAHLAARLNHPGIVQIFDLGKQDEIYYLAMEYLAGEDLYAIARLSGQRKRLIPIEVAARIAACTAEALHYAHQAVAADGRALGIVHRDISPSNLFVTYQGVVKVLDFGIARAEQRFEHTRTGQVKGKAAYIAPEQAKGLTVDRRADVWSLGVCLHEMLTGQRLFARDSPGATLEAVINGPIESLRATRPEVPEELEEIVMTALARDTGARFATAEAMRASLDRFLAARTYIPQTVLLGHFLRDLFGEERAETRLRLASASTPRAQPASGTLELLGQGTEASEPTLPATALGLTVGDRPALIEAQSQTATAPRLTGFVRGHPRWMGLAAVTALGVIAAGVGVLRALADPERSSPAKGTTEDRLVAPGSAAALPPAGPSLPATVPPEQARAPADPPGPPAAPPEQGRGAPGSAAVKPPTPPRPAASPRVASAAPVPKPAERPRSQPGLLTVESNLPATVWLDGARIGSAPIARVKISAGEHRIKLENAALGLSRVERVQVRSGEETLHRVVFRKGKLNVTVQPWADVWLDGAKLGQTPLAAREVWEGRHRLRLVGPQGEKTVTVDVAAGETAVVRERLP